jgi:hypothetical protein
MTDNKSLYNPYDALNTGLLNKIKKKLFPKIVIWSLTLNHKTCRESFATYYFLSYDKLCKFISKNSAAWNSEYTITIDGGFLWF